MDNKFHEHSGKENKCNLIIGWKCRTIYIHCILYNSVQDMLTRALNVDSYGCVHLNVGDGPYDECNNHDPGRNQGGEQMPRRLSILESLTEHHEELGFFFLVRPHLEIKVRWHVGDFASLGGGVGVYYVVFSFCGYWRAQFLICVYLMDLSIYSILTFGTVALLASQYSRNHLQSVDN